jgi:hypothetical protein
MAAVAARAAPTAVGAALSDAEMGAIDCAAPSRTRSRVAQNPFVRAAVEQPFDRAAHLEAARVQRKRLRSERGIGDGCAAHASVEASAPNAAQHVTTLTVKVPRLVQDSLATVAGRSQLLQFVRLARNTVQLPTADAHHATGDDFSRMQFFFQQV